MCLHDKRVCVAYVCSTIISDATPLGEGSKGGGEASREEQVTGREEHLLRWRSRRGWGRSTHRVEETREEQLKGTKGGRRTQRLGGFEGDIKEERSSEG